MDAARTFLCHPICPTAYSGRTITNPENFAGELEADLKCKSEARTTQGAVLSTTVLRLLLCRSTLPGVGCLCHAGIRAVRTFVTAFFGSPLLVGCELTDCRHPPKVLP
ncbi:hypothetical protein BDV93DRAFT_264167 [Ceratobasidium sp. AG-I]|nr:hypothetical protein BDV93DRAFT_264167 [Ceratobasidium sp. AG-I]